MSATPSTPTTTAGSSWMGRSVVGRVATAGLVTAMLSVVAVATWSDAVGRDATDEAASATALADAYDEARDALARQETERHHVLLTPDEPGHVELNRLLEQDVTAALTVLADQESGSHRAPCGGVAA
jgi:hypothetical protein